MTTLPPASVPDSDALRRAMLAASWKRDQVVARRRIMWRWALWLLKRYGWMAGMLTAMGIAGWWWMQRPSDIALNPEGDAILSAPAEATAAPLPSIDQSTETLNTPTDPTAEQAVSLTEQVPLTDSVPDTGIVLRHSQWAETRSLVKNVPLPAATPAGNPSLKSEDWLHSKEP